MNLNVFSHESVVCTLSGVAASQDQDFGTANVHVEVSDVVSVLVYVGVAKGNGVLSKTGKTDVNKIIIRLTEIVMYFQTLCKGWERKKQNEE